jgi:hypothetical protein
VTTICEYLVPGAGEWIRTTDLLITNQLLCQLSYTGMVWRETGGGESIPPLSGTRYEPSRPRNVMGAV